MTHQVNTDELKENISKRSTWLRLLYMVLFAAIIVVTKLVIAVVVIVQFGFVLLTGETNADLKSFGGALSRYVFDILQFLTFNSEELAFPFADWGYGGTAAAAAPAKPPTKKKAARKKTTKKKTSRS